tara:strand:+ start:442 stop:873 length:432 start_codon:yes stop_codon:yes gene_type:complete
MSYKGRFKPKHYKKYKGDPTKIIYRSMWELRFMKYCDKNPSILEWSSEEIVIPYRGLDKKIHRYFPDFWIKYKNAQGNILCEVIEVKPKRQTQKPTKKNKPYGKYLKESRTYGINQLKWKAAREYCADRNYKFRILTEDHLVK